MRSVECVIEHHFTMVDDGRDDPGYTGHREMMTTRLIYDLDRPHVVTLTRALIGHDDPRPAVFPRALLAAALADGEAAGESVEIHTERVHRDHDFFVFTPDPWRADSWPVTAPREEVDAFLAMTYQVVPDGGEDAAAGLTGPVDWDAAAATLPLPRRGGAGSAGRDGSGPGEYRAAS